MDESVYFDRAASYYDSTRSLPDHVMKRIVWLITAEMEPSAHCLEIGVGTGRFAIPVARAGVKVTGVDISPAMLRRLMEKSNGVTIRVAVADATRLPFGDRTFSAGIAAHVLHLIPRWRAAIDELTRVLRPGATLIVGQRAGRTHGDWWHAVRNRFYEAAGSPAWPPGLDRIEELDEAMSGRGAAVRALPLPPEPRTFSIREGIGLLEAGVYSACWSLDEPARHRAAAEATEWARRNVGDLDEPRSAEDFLTWRAYHLR